VAEPGNADALADLQAADAGTEPIDASNDFMAGNDRDARMWELPVHHMQIGAADSAGRNFQPNLAGAGEGVRSLDGLERRSDPVQHHGAHKILRPDERQCRPGARRLSNERQQPRQKPRVAEAGGQARADDAPCFSKVFRLRALDLQHVEEDRLSILSV
jgi:hypothetical protein